MALNSRLTSEFERAIGILRQASELSIFLDRLTSTGLSNAHIHHPRTENTEGTQGNASSSTDNRRIATTADTTLFGISASTTLTTRAHESNSVPMTSCQGCQSMLGHLHLRADSEQGLHRQQQDHLEASGSASASSHSHGPHSESSRSFDALPAMLDFNSMSNPHVSPSTEPAMSNLALSDISLCHSAEATSYFAAQIDDSGYVQDALQRKNDSQGDMMGRMGDMLAPSSDNLSNSATWSVPEPTYDLPNIHEIDRQGPFDLGTTQSTMPLNPTQVQPVDSHSPMLTPMSPPSFKAMATCNGKEPAPPLANLASSTSAVADTRAPSFSVDTSSSQSKLTDMQSKCVLATSTERQSLPRNKQNKRKRRASHEVCRKYRCDFSGCEKAYGELQHLNTHIVQMSHGLKRKKKDFCNPSRSSQTSQGQLFGATIVQALRDLWSFGESELDEAISSDMTLNQLRQALLARPSGSSFDACTRRSSRLTFPPSQDIFQRSSSNRRFEARRDSSSAQRSTNRGNRSRHPTVRTTKVQRMDKHSSQDCIDNNDARDHDGRTDNVEDNEDELSDETIEEHHDPRWDSGTEADDNEEGAVDED